MAITEPEPEPEPPTPRVGTSSGLDTPAAVAAVAESLGIEPEEEWDLMWLARECLLEPVQAGWRVEMSEGGIPLFIEPGEEEQAYTTHPSAVYFSEALSELRKVRDVGSRDPELQWMSFVGVEGVYQVNWRTGETVSVQVGTASSVSIRQEIVALEARLDELTESGVVPSSGEYEQLVTEIQSLHGQLDAAVAPENANAAGLGAPESTTTDTHGSSPPKKARGVDRGGAEHEDPKPGRAGWKSANTDNGPGKGASFCSTVCSYTLQACLLLLVATIITAGIFLLGSVTGLSDAPGGAVRWVPDHENLGVPGVITLPCHSDTPEALAECLAALVGEPRLLTDTEAETQMRGGISSPGEQPTAAAASTTDTDALPRTGLGKVSDDEVRQAAADTAALELRQAKLAQEETQLAATMAQAAAEEQAAAVLAAVQSEAAAKADAADSAESQMIRTAQQEAREAARIPAIEHSKEAVAVEQEEEEEEEDKQAAAAAAADEASGTEQAAEHLPPQAQQQIPPLPPPAPGAAAGADVGAIVDSERASVGDTGVTGVDGEAAEEVTQDQKPTEGKGEEGEDKQGMAAAAAWLAEVEAAEIAQKADADAALQAAADEAARQQRASEAQRQLLEKRGAENRADAQAEQRSVEQRRREREEREAALARQKRAAHQDHEQSGEQPQEQEKEEQQPEKKDTGTVDEGDRREEQSTQPVPIEEPAPPPPSSRGVAPPLSRKQLERQRLEEEEKERLKHNYQRRNNNAKRQWEGFTPSNSRTVDAAPPIAAEAGAGAEAGVELLDEPIAVPAAEQSSEATVHSTIAGDDQHSDPKARQQTDEREQRRQNMREKRDREREIKVTVRAEDQPLRPPAAVLQRLEIAQAVQQAQQEVALANAAASPPPPPEAAAESGAVSESASPNPPLMPEWLGKLTPAQRQMAGFAADGSLLQADRPADPAAAAPPAAPPSTPKPKPPSMEGVPDNVKHLLRDGGTELVAPVDGLTTLDKVRERNSDRLRERQKRLAAAGL